MLKVWLRVSVKKHEWSGDLHPQTGSMELENQATSTDVLLTVATFCSALHLRFLNP